jgi:single-strand DNA-binding protein
MNNLNSIIIEGNLTHDPESNVIPNGNHVCNMRIASNRYYKRGDEQCQEVMYIGMESWGTNAQVCSEYLRKGSWVRAVGRLKQERWKNAEGASRERFVVVAEHIEFRSPMKRQEGQQEEAESAAAGSIEPLPAVQ